MPRKSLISALVVLVVPALVSAAVPGSEAAVRKATHYTALSATQLARAGGPVQRDVAISSSGKRAYVLADNALHVLDITRNPARVVSSVSGVFGTTIAVSGHYAYVGHDESLFVVRLTGARPKKVHSYNSAFSADINDLAVSRNGKLLAVGYGGTFDPNTGVRLLSLSHPSAPRKLKKLKVITPSALAFNRAGTTLAVGDSLGATVRLANVSKPARAHWRGGEIELPQQNSPAGSVFSNDGRSLYVIGGDDSTIMRIGVRSQSVSRTKTVGRTEGDGGTDIAISGNGSWLFATFRGQEDDGTFVVLGSAKLAVRFRGGGVQYPRGVAVSTNGPTAGRAYAVSFTQYDKPSYFIGVRRTH